MNVNKSTHNEVMKTVDKICAIVLGGGDDRLGALKGSLKSLRLETSGAFVMELVL